MPLLWWQLRRLRHAIEVDCDARVLMAGHNMTTYGAIEVYRSPRLALELLRGFRTQELLCSFPPRRVGDQLYAYNGRPAE
jgi:hypothetical protein